jgi:hypothetical protein
MTTRKSAGLALLGSCVVYVIPIVGPHAAFLVVEALWQQFRDFKSPSWAYTNLAVALGLQAVTFGLFYWSWHRRSVLPFLASAAWCLAAVVLVQFIYMLWVPAMFLIEAESSPETGAWAQACSVPQSSTMTLRTPRRVPKGGWQEVWVSDTQNHQFLIRMPDCQRIQARLPQPHMEPGGRVDFSIGIVQVVPGGVALVQRQEVSTGKITWLLLDAPAGTLTPLPAPPTDKFVAPYLSDDGSHTAWILPVPGSRPPILEAVHVLPVQSGGHEKLLDLSPFGPASYETVGMDDAAGDILLWVSLPGKLLATSLDGKEHLAPALPSTVRPQSQTIVLTDHGALAGCLQRRRQLPSCLVDGFRIRVTSDSTRQQHQRRGGRSVGPLRGREHDDDVEHRSRPGLRVRPPDIGRPRSVPTVPAHVQPLECGLHRSGLFGVLRSQQHPRAEAAGQLTEAVRCERANRASRPGRGPARAAAGRVTPGPVHLRPPDG